MNDSNHPTALNNDQSKQFIHIKRHIRRSHRSNDRSSNAGSPCPSHSDSMYFSSFDGEAASRCGCCCGAISECICGCCISDGSCCCSRGSACIDIYGQSNKSSSKRHRRERHVMSNLMGHIIYITCFLAIHHFAFHVTGKKHSRSIHVSAFQHQLHNPSSHRIIPTIHSISSSKQHKLSRALHILSSQDSSTNNNNSPQNPATLTPSSQQTNEYSFFDEATIYIRAGSGGQGSSTYKRGIKNQNGPPDGGNGGKGGNVVFLIDESLNTLAGLARYAWRPNSFGGGGGAKRRRGENNEGGVSNRILTFRAENGADGERQRRQGRNGKDVVVRVPPGTVVQEEVLTTANADVIVYDDDEEVSDSNNDIQPTYKDLGTITRFNPTMIIATGGQGGEGSAINSQRGVRRPRNPPQGGERKRLKLTLKVVADVALVAVPNAGKSTLLGKVTRAKPKIADYPFTTVVPNLGVWVPSKDFEVPDEEERYDQGDDDMAPSNSKSLILCDVPGLMAGASDGIGLGHAFLRHVERCHVILHLLDATSDKVLDEYAMINKELMRYGTGKLASMPQVVVVNKVDVAFGEDPGEIERKKQELESKLRDVMPHSRLMWISAKEGEGVDDLMERVALFVRKVKEVSAKEERASEVES